MPNNIVALCESDFCKKVPSNRFICKTKMELKNNYYICFGTILRNQWHDYYFVDTSKIKLTFSHSFDYFEIQFTTFKWIWCLLWLVRTNFVVLLNILYYLQIQLILSEYCFWNYIGKAVVLKLMIWNEVRFNKP